MNEPEIRVAIMQPKYQINLGYIARAAKNFGIKELYLIKPRCNWKGKMAIQYSKHAHSLLENAKICESMEEATKGFVVVGTTGIWRKAKSSFYNGYSLENFYKLAKQNKQKRICILVGRDDIGLTSDEIGACDAVVFIPADREYPVLNISHAFAILLYEFRRGTYNTGIEKMYATEKDVENLSNIFYQRLSKNEKIRDRKAVSTVFKRIVKRAKPTKMEINALHAAFSDD